MSNFCYLTGEELIPPSERRKDAINMITPASFNGMTTEEILNCIEVAKAEVNRRNNERSAKLINKVCADLNELKRLGVEFIVEDCDGYDFWVFGADQTITPHMFRIPEVK